MVSTMASGNTTPYIDSSDICLMPSVVDIAGLNTVSRRVLSNAAHAMAGMVQNVISESVERQRPTIGMTMFGVTTTCVTAVRNALEVAGFDCLVFHATGAGGRAMEKLVESGLIEGVLDITTTEVADEVVGGILQGVADGAGIVEDRARGCLEQRIVLEASDRRLDGIEGGASALEDSLASAQGCRDPRAARSVLSGREIIGGRASPTMDCDGVAWGGNAERAHQEHGSDTDTGDSSAHDRSVC